ncbi:MAG TPA: acylphosphatase [Lactobacillus sp.]|nr:acylphosphatase [Lactobacillus sp.]
MAQTAVLLTAHGRVQGVGFRYSTYQLAIRHHIFGFVRNNSDGTVTILAQGAPSMISIFTDAIAQSPNSWAHVTKLEQVPQQIQPLKKFDIY